MRFPSPFGSHPAEEKIIGQCEALVRKYGVLRVEAALHKAEVEMENEAEKKLIEERDKALLRLKEAETALMQFNLKKRKNDE